MCYCTSSVAHTTKDTNSVAANHKTRLYCFTNQRYKDTLKYRENVNPSNQITTHHYCPYTIVK